MSPCLRYRRRADAIGVFISQKHGDLLEHVEVAILKKTKEAIETSFRLAQEQEGGIKYQEFLETVVVKKWGLFSTAENADGDNKESNGNANAGNGSNNSAVNTTAGPSPAPAPAPSSFLELLLGADDAAAPAPSKNNSAASGSGSSSALANASSNVSQSGSGHWKRKGWGV